MMKKIFFSLVILTSLASQAAIVDTISIYSSALHREKKCVVILPSIAREKNIRLPVVYLLHGYSGDYSNWITRVPDLKSYADLFLLMIVCPDGDYNSWYVDSPVDTSSRYETFIAREVPEWIDAHYPTIAQRKARAITGLSMGGHGGLMLGFRDADVFGACGSMSGGVDLMAFHNRFDISKKIGDSLTHAADYAHYSVMQLVEHYPKDSIAIIFDCGTEDFFYPYNHRLHEKMLQLKIAHDYIERPGGHTWNYWSNAVQYQLLFFRNYFDRMMQG